MHLLSIPLVNTALKGPDAVSGRRERDDEVLDVRIDTKRGGVFKIMRRHRWASGAGGTYCALTAIAASACLSAYTAPSTSTTTRRRPSLNLNGDS